ncbi:hypothetical protein LEP1GSC071_3602 [Leptospira santarosai str. JET]|nr:hypothetical protein LEP1GSC071_3602 [Leptospira santarosai str. JET]EMO83163.1 hypothetical protein LEP1GSC070_2585 [Leptospira santarosai str. AIM]
MNLGYVTGKRIKKMRILFLKRIRYNKCESDCYVAIVGATPKFLIRPNSKPSNSRFFKEKTDPI